MVNYKLFEDLELFEQAWIHSARVLTDIQDIDYLRGKFIETFKNELVEVYNSVKGRMNKTQVSKFLTNVAKKYIIVENGCFFLKHDIFTAPAAVSFDILKKLRAYYKSGMKKAKGEGRTLDVGFYSLMQQNTKEALNTYYGIMINILSKYYNYDVAGSTTIRGRSTVSMNGLTIEYVFGYYRPYNLSIHLHFINEACKKDLTQEEIDFWFKDVKLPDNFEILDKLLLHHNDGTYYGTDILFNRINRLSDNERYLVYYTGNFEAFLQLPKAQEYILKIMKTQNDDYDKAEKILNGEGNLWVLKSILYLDPTEGPEKLKKYFDDIDKYFEDILYGYYWYEGDVNEYGERLDSTEFIFDSLIRSRIIITDTDSLIIHLDQDMKKIKNIPGFNEVTDRFSKEMLDYVTGSFIINAISKVVQKGLKRYTLMSNIDPKYGKEINYKQEYFFCTLQTTKGAKNYIGYIGIQEGVLLPTKEIDLKGLSLKKSNFNPTISKRAKDLVLEKITKKENPDLRDILRTIDRDRKELEEMYRSKENINMFTISKYKKGYDELYDYEKGNDRIKACQLYNHLYPDKENIPIPGSFLVASIDFIDRVEELKESYPTQYQRIYDYNEERLITRVKVRVRQAIRKVLDIRKEDEISLENCTDLEVFNFMTNLDSLNTREEIVNYLKENKEKHKNASKNKGPFNSLILAICEKIKMEPNKIEEVNKIAIPLDSEEVDPFITEYLATKDTVVYENLVSVILEGLGLLSVRNNSGRNTLSNVISYF